MGFVPIDRGICRTRAYNPKDFYYLFDLHQLAAYDDRLFDFRGRGVLLRRGQFVTTYDWLAARWEKSKHWVHDFLHRVEKERLVKLEPVTANERSGTDPGTRLGTLITLLMYDPQGLPRASPRATGNAVGNAIGNMKEEVNDKEAAAVVASDRESRPTPTAEDVGTASLPSWVSEVVEVERTISGRNMTWAPDQLAELAELVGGGVSPEALRSRVADIARRQATLGAPPRSPHYYIKALTEDLLPPIDPGAAARLRALSSGIVKPAPYTHLERPQEPDHEATMKGIAELGKIIGVADDDD